MALTYLILYLLSTTQSYYIKYVQFARRYILMLNNCNVKLVVLLIIEVGMNGANATDSRFEKVF